MRLNYKQYSTEGKPTLILHGLFGSLSNWGWHSKQLAENFAIYAVDLRNHGDSPHAPEMSYKAMAQDVAELLSALDLTDVQIIGHSMGGKVAMQLALDHPDLVTKLVVVDIAPVTYPDHAGGHTNVITGMKELPLAETESRIQAELFLEKFIEGEDVRKFILTNLVKNSTGRFSWRLNLAAIEANYDALRLAPELDAGEVTVFDKPVLFVKGALSGYIRKQNEAAIKALFPQATVKTIAQAGHWLHAEKPKAFQTVVRDFLDI